MAEIGKWLVTHHGLGGVILIGLWTIILALSSALVYVFRLYVKQLSKCAQCKEESETRHDADMTKHYDVMRQENRLIWDRVEGMMNRLTDAVSSLSGRTSELSGKLNGMKGGH